MEKEYKHQKLLLERYGVEISGVMNEEYERGIEKRITLGFKWGIVIGITFGLIIQIFL